MFSGGCIRWALAAATCGALALGPATTALAWQLDSHGQPSAAQTRAAYDTGFREGMQRGQTDAR